jgi:hypothetical protein
LRPPGGGTKPPALARSSPMAAILTILAFLLVFIALNFFEFGRGD